VEQTEDAEAHALDEGIKEVLTLPVLREVGRERKRGSVRTAMRGETADHLARHIARDHPDILQRMKAGEFFSVRAAAKAAW
jgi:hypothetical protein